MKFSSSISFFSRMFVKSVYVGCGRKLDVALRIGGDYKNLFLSKPGLESIWQTNFNFYRSDLCEWIVTWIARGPLNPFFISLAFSSTAGDRGGSSRETIIDFKSQYLIFLLSKIGTNFSKRKICPRNFNLFVSKVKKLIQKEVVLGF